jgi:hypothetical protein
LPAAGSGCEEDAMAKGVLFTGWTEARTGREHAANELFMEVLGTYARWQAEGKLDSFEPVLLRPHGGDLNGFILARGDQQKLDALRNSDEWLNIEARAVLCVDGFGVTAGVVGEGLQHMMQIWTKHIPQK